MKTLVKNNTAFAVDLYQALRGSEGNIFFSPYSISTALAMTYAGARGNTEKEMAETLGFTLEGENPHAAFAAIETRLDEVQKTGNVALNVANALWPQKGYDFLDEYLSLISKHYGVSVTPLDYKSAPDAARKTINEWVENETQEKITDLIPPGVLTPLTRLVLANAIYFKGDWQNRFKADRTEDAPFFVTPDASVQTPMMTQKEKFGYVEDEAVQTIELPYVGNDLSMVVVLPKRKDGLERLESGLTAEKLEKWRRALMVTKMAREVVVFLPKFKMRSAFRLDKTLMAMGMVDAFSEARANFAGMDGRTDWLYIGAVLHKAFVDVNEEGTEAAAATSVVAVARSALPVPPVTFRADHPFIFLIYENRTGSILFMGRVTDPAK